MENLGLMERFANPEFFESLSFGEKMSAGGVTLLMGMGITFVILTIILFAIKIMGKLMNGGKKKEEAKPAAAAASAPVPAAAAVTAETTEDGKLDPALVAVIMAAIAASEGPEIVDHLRVSRITRISGNCWKQASIGDCMESRTW